MANSPDRINTNQCSELLSEAEMNRLYQHGYLVIDNFLPNDLYGQLLSELKTSSVECHYQVRPNHYSHIFSSNIQTLPGADEPYIAKFSLIKQREKLETLRKVFLDYLTPILKAASQGKAKYSLFPAAVRMRSGDVYRSHHDGFAGIVGFSLFVNEGWSWDYGGILTYVRDEFTAEAIFPQSNRLVLRNETMKHFHFLNTVEQYCPKEQFLILGWADSKAADASKSLGSYHEF